MPLDTECGYHLNVERSAEVDLSRPVFDIELYCYIVPMREGIRVTSGSEIGGLAIKGDYRRLHRVLDKAREVVSGLDGAVTREWMGYRPSMPDSKPVIDQSTHFSNVFFAFGHGHSGLTQAAATAELIGDLVTGREPRIDLGASSCARF